MKAEEWIKKWREDGLYLRAYTTGIAEDVEEAIRKKYGIRIGVSLTEHDVSLDAVAEFLEKLDEELEK